MGTIFIGVGEYAVSKRSGDVLKMMALGSCIGVIMFDLVSGTVGAVHVALPDSSINEKKAVRKPGMFAETGIAMLLNKMNKLAIDKKNRFIVKIAGGASIMDPNNTFNIGKRNILAVRKYLWKHRLGAIAEDVGESFSRTVTVSVDTKRIIISSPGRGEWEL